MQTMRESGTDERLDNLNGSMNERFDQVNDRFEQIDARFAQVDARFKEVDARFDKVEIRLGNVEARLDRMDVDIRELRKMLVQGFIATITIMVTCFFGLTGLLFLFLL